MKKNFLALISLFAVSFIITTVVTHFYGDTWEEYMRGGLYAITNDSIPNYAQENVDENGIPFVYYPEQNGITAGKQYNPTIVCNFALDYYKSLLEKNDAQQLQRFRNCVQWLAQNISWHQGYALFIFNWQQPWYDSVGAPYTSGMTSGLAIEVFTKASQLLKQPAYLQYAAALRRGFYLPIDSGGFTYKNSFGWWYEELADTAMHTPYILDGHIFATTGVFHYWKNTGDDSAKYVYQKGLEALKHYLPMFDAGDGKIYYDRYGKLADKKYHRILTRQMKELYQLTGDEVFNQYYQKWVAPLNRPYILRVVGELNRSGIMLLMFLTGIFFIILYAVYRLLQKKNSA